MPLVNKLFVKCLLGLMLGIGILICLLKLSRLSSLTPTFFVELFLLGAVVFHKRSVPVAWLQRGGQSPLNAFMRSFVVYFVPALLLWALLVAQLLIRYLPHLGIAILPFWVVLFFAAGALFLARALLKPELARARGYE